MNRQDQNKKKPNWIVLAIVLLVTMPQLVIPVAFFGGVIYLVIRASKNNQNPTQTPAQRPAIEKCAGSKFDDCPQPLFCFHKDKGEHHVVRGKEMDPWDRPDIDISKYQRRQ